jgi:hypothetical protein
MTRVDHSRRHVGREASFAERSPALRRRDAAIERTAIMTVYVTAISPGTAKEFKHIVSIRWLNSSDSTSDTMSIASTVAWMKKGNALVVAGKGGPTTVEVVNEDPPYIRTVANNTPTDNLLNLPRF